MMKEKILAILNHIVMFYTQESVIGSGFGGVWKNCLLSAHTKKKSENTLVNIFWEQNIIYHHQSYCFKIWISVTEKKD